MERKRLWHTLRLWITAGSDKRTEYLKRKNVFGAIGENCSIMDRKIPLYAELIQIGNNVHIASKVDFVTHDISHVMLNGLTKKNSGGKAGNDDRPKLVFGQSGGVKEKAGCIRIKDNVFVGAHTTILYDVEIGTNVIIGAGSLVNRDVPDNSVAAGVPAKVIGSFESFVSKRMQEQMPDIYRPKHQRVSKASAQYFWSRFEDIRKERICKNEKGNSDTKGGENL